MYLIKTIAGTIRLMSDDEIDMDDLNIPISHAYKFLKSKQKDDMLYGYKTKLTSSQLEKIMGLIL